MNQKLIATLSASVLVAIIVMCCQTYESESNSTLVDSSGNQPVDKSIFLLSQPEKPYDIIVFGSESQCSAMGTVSEPVGLQSLEQYGGDRPFLAVMNKEWVDSGTAELVREIFDMNSAVAVVGSSFDWSSAGISMTYPLSANVVSVVKTDLGTSSFSCICSLDNEAMSRLISWSDSVFSQSYAVSFSSS